MAEQAIDAVRRAETLADLREDYRSRLHGDRSRAIEVVDLLFENPILVTNRVARRLGVSVQSALSHVRKLEDLQIVAEIPGISGRSKRWLSHEVFYALDPNESPVTDRR